jgi:hypothetical protein
MVVRWVSASIVEAKKRFRRVQGWRDIEKLARALDVLETNPQEQEATAKRVAQDQSTEPPLREDQHRAGQSPSEILVGFATPSFSEEPG